LLPVLATDLAEADRVVEPRATPFVALNPGAGDPRRRWRPERFAVVGDRLAALGYAVVVVGGPLDVELAHAVVEAMTADAIDVAGRLSLGGLLGLFRRCRLVVSNDSGPLHLARSVGAPTVGIYVGPNAVNAGPTIAARHRMLVAWSQMCPRCGMPNAIRRCSHDDSFLDEVDAREVGDAAVELLGECA
jgi:ADP-heptose:LPS heptosyltransferase